jgi:hypothetical protein
MSLLRNRVLLHNSSNHTLSRQQQLQLHLNLKSWSSTTPSRTSTRSRLGSRRNPRRTRRSWRSYRLTRKMVDRFKRYELYPVSSCQTLSDH